MSFSLRTVLTIIALFFSRYLTRTQMLVRYGRILRPLSKLATSKSIGFTSRRQRQARNLQPLLGLSVVRNLSGERVNQLLQRVCIGLVGIRRRAHAVYHKKDP